MCQTPPKTPQKNSRKTDERSQIDAMLRRLTLFKKAVIRLVRRRYSTRRQYPECVRQVEWTCVRLHTWLRTYVHFWRSPIFQRLLTEFLHTLRQQYIQVLAVCSPKTDASGTTRKKGKKGKKGAGSRTAETHRELCGRIEMMLRDLEEAVNTPASCVGCVAHAFEAALRTAFEMVTVTSPTPSSRSPRGAQTVVFPYQHPDTYATWVEERTRVTQEVVAKLGREIPVTGHAPGCLCHTGYAMKGFRGTPRKCRMVGGQQAIFPIRMVECRECGRSFSLLPSFLAREKQYALEIIGHVVEKMTLYAQSLSASLKDLEILSPGGHSKQTPLDWLGWFGARHPAEVLTQYC